MGRYVVRDDVAVADCALEIEGRDLNDLFETVARAVAELMVDPATVATTVRREIALAAPALDLLLFDWIAELIFLKDSEQLIFTETSVAVQAEPPCRLVARVAGGLIDRERTDPARRRQGPDPSPLRRRAGGRGLAGPRGHRHLIGSSQAVSHADRPPRRARAGKHRRAVSPAPHRGCGASSTWCVPAQKRSSARSWRTWPSCPSSEPRAGRLGRNLSKNARSATALPGRSERGASGGPSEAPHVYRPI